MRVVLPRLGALALAAAVVAATVASSAYAALFFFFAPTVAKPGDRVTIRTAPYTPANFTLRQREKPFHKPVRVYLVRNEISGRVRSRFDPRLHFIGSIVPDGLFRGLLTFVVPPLDTDEYLVAAWLPADPRYGRKPTFFVMPVTEDTSQSYRRQMLLHLEMPSASETCPVTIPTGGRPPPGLSADPDWHGNGFLWTRLQSDGVFVPPPANVGWPGDPEGSVGTKLFWLAAHVFGPFTLRGQRLDDPSSPPLVVHRVNRGTMTGFRGTGTWATPVTFPNEGCWRLTARVRDITLSYVVKVVAP